MSSGFREWTLARLCAAQREDGPPHQELCGFSNSSGETCFPKPTLSETHHLLGGENVNSFKIDVGSASGTDAGTAGWGATLLPWLQRGLTQAGTAGAGQGSPGRGLPCWAPGRRSLRATSGLAGQVALPAEGLQASVRLSLETLLPLFLVPGDGTQGHVTAEPRP